MALQLEYRVIYTVMYGVNTLVFLYSAQYTYDHIVHFKMNYEFYFYCSILGLVWMHCAAKCLPLSVVWAMTANELRSEIIQFQVTRLAPHLPT